MNTTNTKINLTAHSKHPGVRARIRPLIALGLAVVSVLVSLSSASAQSIVNGGFSYTGNLTSSPNYNDLYTAGVTGWSLSSNSNQAWEEIFTPTSGGIGHAYNILPALTTSIPGGGNMVTFDANIAAFSSTSLYQTINNLTVGQTYSVNFYQALSQQVNNGWASPVTGNWQVSMTDPNNPTGPALNGQTFLSATMYADNSTTPFSYTPWQAQSFVFTASQSSETLNFLSVGTGLPPDVSLANVSLSVVAVPEPGAALLLGVAGFVIILRRSRKRSV